MHFSRVLKRNLSGIRSESQAFLVQLMLDKLWDGMVLMITKKHVISKQAMTLIMVIKCFVKK